jgi:hypothetical protein
VADGMTLVDIEPVVVPRDRWGRPQLLPADAFGPDCTVLVSDKLPKRTGMQRVTTLSKGAESTDSLTGWACRMTLIGAASRPDIIASTQATDPTDRKALDALVEKAKELGGANQRRELGTAVHKFFERKTLDPTYTVPDAYAADVDAILAAIDAAGFDIVVEHSEQMVVIYSIGCAGTPDLILRERATGLYYIGDLKTGASVAYGTLGWATQLSVYSMADAFYIHGADPDGRDDRLVPMPDVSRDRGVIIHCEPGSGHADLYWLTLSETFVDLAVSIREIRKRRDLLTKFEGGGASTTTGTTAGTANAGVVVGSVEDNQPIVAAPVTSPAGSVSSPAGDIVVGTKGRVYVDPDAIVHEAAVAWIINRTDAIIAALSKQHVGAAWPTDIPRPLAIKNGDAAWTGADLDAIANALDALERKHALELPLSADPRTLARKRAAAEAKAVEAATPPPRLEHLRRACPDDTAGPFATEDQLTALYAIVTEMKQSPDPATRERLGRVSVWQRHAETVAPWRTRQGPNSTTPLRIWAIGMAALACADLIDLDADDPDHRVRNLLAVHLGDDAHKPANTIGALFGVLTLDQAIAIGDR